MPRRRRGYAFDTLPMHPPIFLRGPQHAPRARVAHAHAPTRAGVCYAPQVCSLRQRWFTRRPEQLEPSRAPPRSLASHRCCAAASARGATLFLLSASQTLVRHGESNNEHRPEHTIAVSPSLRLATGGCVRSGVSRRVARASEICRGKRRPCVWGCDARWTREETCGQECMPFSLGISAARRALHHYSRGADAPRATLFRSLSHGF